MNGNSVSVEWSPTYSQVTGLAVNVLTWQYFSENMKIIYIELL